MEPIKTILAPTDFSHAANVAAAYAGQLGAQLGGNVVLLHVFDAPLGAVAAERLDVEYPQALKDAALAELHELCTAIARPEVPIRCLAVRGDAKTEIARVAADERADVIVMGTHGRSGLGHLFLGSVTQAVLRAAPIPVLAVGRTAMDAARQHAVAP